MSKYKYNPKMEDSGMLGCIPQKGRCPNNCPDCFFQSGRSYLEPLDENLPNMPTLEEVGFRVLWVNDGNDSNIQRDLVIESLKEHPLKFYNTSIPRDLEGFKDPVVLTINPAKMTNFSFHRLEKIPKNLMFVRIRVNMWNLCKVVDKAVKYYSKREVAIILTFMAYFNEKIPYGYEKYYSFRKRTLNSYSAIKREAWKKVMERYDDNKWVYSCGNEGVTTKCGHCGTCLREFFATLERL